MNQSADTGITIGQVYVSSVAFSHREDALRLSPKKTDIGNLPLSIAVEVAVEESGKQGLVILRLATKDEENPLYRFRIEMVGLVMHDENATGEMKAHDYIIHSGAFMMYPFLREFVANLTARARFGPIWLRPLDFKTLTDQMQMSFDMARAERATQDKVAEG